MATRHRIMLMTKWKTVNGGYQAEALDDVPVGAVVTDKTGQIGGIIPPNTNVFIVEVDNLTPAQMTALNGNSKYFVLMSESYDNVTNAMIASTYDDVPTAGQLTTFKNTIQARFADVDDDKLNEAGQAVLRAGLTRRQILDELTRRWRRFARA